MSDRDCENCKHHTEKGCDSWDCEFEPCEDAVSRQAVLDAIEDDNRNGHYSCFASNNDAQCFKDVIRSLPSVNPQEPKIDVLDKIRAEIIEEKDFAYADFEQYKIDCLDVDAEYVEDELPQDDFRYGMERAIEIINKYKAESEDKV